MTITTTYTEILTDPAVVVGAAANQADDAVLVAIYPLGPAPPRVPPASIAINRWASGGRPASSSLH